MEINATRSFLDKCPPEVRSYLQNGTRRALSVLAKRPHTVIVEYDDGVCKEYDMSNDLTGVLKPLQDFSLFSGVYVDNDGAISWDVQGRHLDTSADTVYIYGKTVPKQ